MKSNPITSIVVLLLSSCCPAGEIIFEPNIEYANPDNQHLQLNLARPKELADSAKLPAVICIHGGGFRAGNRTRWDALCKDLASRGYFAITIQYRLSPKYQFPAAVEDAKSAVRWVRLNAEKYHVDPDRIGAIGDSAGGHLVQFLAVTGDVKDFDGDQNPGPSSKVTCVVNYYGPSDFTKSYGKSVDAAEVLPMWLGGDLEHARQRHILSSPLNWVTPRAAPSLLIHGTDDKYVAYEQATWMHERLKACGVEVQLLTLEGAGHGFKGADADKAAAAAQEFFNQHLLNPSTVGPAGLDAPAIASKYPGDRGIDQDPKVIFSEDFEEPSINALKKRWDEAKKSDIMSFAPDIPEGSAGKQSLLMTHIGGQGDGGHLYRRLPKGLDRAYARFYVKFDPDCAPIHHFGTCIGGNNPATPWPMVKAGQPPPGDKGFWTGIEPFGENWTWDYYTYWCEMRGSPPRGQTWGNTFVRDDSLKVARGKWTCVEVMVKMNHIGESNGELALWLDGKPISHLGKGFPKGKWVFDKFIPNQGGESVRWNQTKGDRENFQTAAGGEAFEGFRWRTSKDLDVNFVWAYLYITSSPPGHVSKVWFDNIVLATDYIGPITK